MSNYVHLIGTEQVSSAGHRISDAASDMSRAAASLDDSLRRHEQFMENWLDRLERIMSNKNG